VNVALPTIAADLRLTRAELPFTGIAYTLLFGSLLIVGGRAATPSAAARCCAPVWSCSWPGCWRPPPRRRRHSCSWCVRRRVFPAPEGGYLRRSNFRRRSRLPAIRAAGVEGLRFP
jgi:hypothetical protein